jgi:DNA-binding FrmR family transcriptional regulator
MERSASTDRGRRFSRDDGLERVAGMTEARTPRGTGAAGRDDGAQGAGARAAADATDARGAGGGHGAHGGAHGDHGGGRDDDFRHSYSKDRAQLVRRLSRIEGQVRGIARMIEREEYCVDILQQTAALRAAVDSNALLVLEDHVQGCVRTAAANGDADAYVEEILDVVRRTLGRPVRGSGRAT